MRRSMRSAVVPGVLAVLLLTVACSGDGEPKSAADGTTVTTGVMLLKRYDAGSGALQYQGTRKIQEPDEVIAPDGPVRNATVARDARVLSAVGICSGDDATVDEKTGIGTKPCTLRQLDAAIKEGAKIDAHLTMRGGTVVKIAEVYHP